MEKSLSLLWELGSLGEKIAEGVNVNLQLGR